MNEFSVRHSFNAGDLITIMPGLRQIWLDRGIKTKIYQRLDFESHYYEGQVNSTVDSSGNSVCMNERVFSMLKPLIESQEYIQSFEVWSGQATNLDYDKTRDSRSIPLPAGLIHTWAEAIFPETSTDLSKAWISVEQSSVKKGYYKDKVIVNRTQRYNNPYVSFYFLKQYEDQILFSGTETEYNYFCDKWNLDIKNIEADNFYQLAQIISWCKFGVYGQSLNWHIADSMKTKRILEVCAPFPNTFATGANGYHAFGQQALEFHFHKLISQ